MKKFFTFIVAAMLSATMFGAVQYCQEQITANDGSTMALLSMKYVSAQTYMVELVASGEWAFDKPYNVNCGVNQSVGSAGIFFSGDKWTISADGKTASVEFETASAESVPTNLYGQYICMSKVGGGLVEFNLAAITDIDWTTTCPEKTADEEAPVMGTASVASSSYTSITLNVSATDNVGVKRYHVVATGVDKDFTPSNNQIVVTGLTMGTTYSFTITAKDAAGNVSANSAIVENAKTLSAPAAPIAPTHKQANVRSIYSDTYTSALAHDFSKNSWSGIQYSEVTPDENNHYLFYTANADWIAWGGPDDGANSIIAAEGYNDGTNKGLDLSAMEYLHIDIFADADFVSGEITCNDDKLAGLGTIKGGEWNSIDIPLSNLDATKRNNLRWMKFVGLRGVSIVILDNVYAWNKPIDDTEKPVMVSAALVSNTYNKAVIAVSATDNVGVASYRVVDAAHSIDAKYTATDGNITVTGLTAATTYNFTITALDLVGNESDNSMLVSLTTPEHKTSPDALPAAPTYPENQVKAIYSATYSADCDFGDWGSGTTYTQDTYGKKFTTTASGYFGLVGFALNCASMESFHVDVWCEEDMTLRFVPIHGGAEVGVTKSVVGEQWNSIDIPLTEFAGVTNWTNVSQLKIDNVPSKTFWLNNIYFYTTVVPDVDTEAPTDFTASATPSYVSVDITAKATDNSGAVIFQVFNGELLLAKQNAASATAATFTVSGLKAGTAYALTVKAVDETGNAAVNVETLSFTTKALPAAATVPTATATDVQALYSDAYTPVVTRTMGQWSQTTQETEVTLAEGDKALLYTTCNYLGWELGATVDATAYPYLHIDIYVEEAGTIQFTPIWKTAEAAKTYDLVAGWNAFNIDLKADFTAIDLTTIFQLKWANMPTTCFIDNVYFYKQGKTTTIDATLSTSPAKKTIENGQLIITRDGVRYNAMGNRLQ